MKYADFLSTKAIKSRLVAEDKESRDGKAEPDEQTKADASATQHQSGSPSSPPHVPISILSRFSARPGPTPHLRLAHLASRLRTSFLRARRLCCDALAASVGAR